MVFKSLCIKPKSTRLMIIYSSLKKQRIYISFKGWFFFSFFRADLPRSQRAARRSTVSKTKKKTCLNPGLNCERQKRSIRQLIDGMSSRARSLKYNNPSSNGTLLYLELLFLKVKKEIRMHTSWSVALLKQNLNNWVKEFSLFSQEFRSRVYRI